LIGVFADTSALYATLVKDDKNHSRAVRAFRGLATREACLVTSSYVLVEVYALITRRLGLPAVAAFRNDFAPLLDVVWVDGDLHESALDWLLRRGVRDISLVDAVSFMVIRRHQIDEVFAYDRRFSREGFKLV
jgi:predicted nucleic acid-binding protein